MTARPGHVKPEVPTAAESAERLCNTLKAGVGHAERLARASADEFDLYHAGLAAAATQSLKTLLWSMDMVRASLTHTRPEEVTSAVRQDKKQDPPQQGQMRLV